MLSLESEKHKGPSMGGCILWKFRTVNSGSAPKMNHCTCAAGSDTFLTLFSGLEAQRISNSGSWVSLKWHFVKCIWRSPENLCHVCEKLEPIFAFKDRCGCHPIPHLAGQQRFECFLWSAAQAFVFWEKNCF